MFKKYQEKKYYSITLMLLFMLISTALAFLAFKFANINSANIALIYILALILTARYTNGYWYGIVFALFSVICINLHTLILISILRCPGIRYLSFLH